MNFWRRGDKKKPELVPAAEVVDTRPPMQLVDRLVELKDANREVVIKLYRRKKAGGRAAYVGDLYLSQFEPLHLESVVREEYGGGSYEVRLASTDGKLLTLKSNPREPELYQLEIEGEAKTQKREKAESDRKPLLDLEGVVKTMSTGEGLILVTKVLEWLFGQRVDPATVVNQIFEGLSKAQALTGQRDPVEQFTGMATAFGSIYNAMQRPPVTTQGGPGTGFWDSLGKAAAPIVQSMLPQGTQPGQQATTQPALSGAAPQAYPAPAPQPEPSMPAVAPVDNSAPNPVMAGMGILQAVRWMVQNKMDPDEVASYAIDAVNILTETGANSSMPPAVRGLIDNPAQAVDALPLLIPELNQDEAYRERFKSKVVDMIGQWKAQQGQEDEVEDGFPSIEDIQPAHGQEDAGDGQPGDAEVDEDQDAEGAEH